MLKINIHLALPDPLPPQRLIGEKLSQDEWRKTGYQYANDGLGLGLGK